MALTLTERPKTFDEVKGHDEVVENLRKQFQSRKFSHFYILEGNRGSGKTTIGRIIAKAVNCQNPDERGNPCCKCSACMQIQNGNSPDYSELDAASNNGVDSTRALIDATNYVPMNLKYKVMLIDEAHMLTTAAFNAFLKTLEEPPEYCIFIMATTDVNKIPITVQSRAMIYQFKRISVEIIKEHVISVAKKYDVSIEPDAAAIIAKKATGAMRDALSDLEKCLLVGDTITVSDVMEVCGIADVERLLLLVENLCDYDRTEAFTQVEELYAKGRDLKYCVSECLTILTDIIKYKNSKDDRILCQTEAYNEKVVHLAERTNNARLSSVADGLMKLKTELYTDPSRNNVLIHVLKMCEPALDVSLLFEKIRQLEAVVSGNGQISVSVEKQPEKKPVAQNSMLEKPEKVRKPDNGTSKPAKNKAENKPQNKTQQNVEKQSAEVEKKPVEKASTTDVISSENGMYHLPKKKKKPVEKPVETSKPKKPSAAGLDLFGSMMNENNSNSSDGFEKVSTSEDVPFEDNTSTEKAESKVQVTEQPAEQVEETKPQTAAEQAVESISEQNTEDTTNAENQHEDEKSAIDELLANDVIRHAVENHCTVLEKEDETVITSTFAPIVRMVNSFIQMYHLNGIEARVK